MGMVTPYVACISALLTYQGTPNGWKASILLEELKEAYGKEYTWQAINIGTNVQKEPWFTKLGPNGRIPVIVDHDQGGFAVQEGLCKSIPTKDEQDRLCNNTC